MIGDLPADDLLGHRRAMLVDVVAEIGLRGVRAGREDLGHAGQRRADLAEELVLGPHRAAVLASVVRVRGNLVGLDVLGIELQDLRVVMVDPNHGVRERHEDS